MSTVRPRRSALYIPGSNRRAIEKAAALDSDVLIFDLEDSVAPTEKDLSRSQIITAVKARQRFGRKELVIRINSAESPWYFNDLQGCLDACPDAILLPKVENPAAIGTVVEFLESSRAPADISVWAMLETPRGVLRAESIAACHDRLECLVMGTSDLTNDLRALHTPDRLPMLCSLGLCVLAARAFGKSILDGVSLDLSDLEAFRVTCRQGRELGFDGKTVIHPRQLSDCNIAFSPTAEELERATAIVETYSAALAEGRGVAVFEGRLIEEMHVREAERMRALASAIAAKRLGPVGTPGS